MNGLTNMGLDETYKEREWATKAGNKAIQECTYWYGGGHTVVRRYYRPGEKVAFRTTYL